MGKNHYTDTELLAMFRKAEQNSFAFHLLVKKHQTKIYWQVRRMVFNHDDANDIVQHIFIKIWKGLPQFREDAKLSTWIHRIAINETLSFLKKQKLRALLHLKSYEAYQEQQLLNDTYFSGEEIQQKLQLALVHLPEKQRLVFNLRYIDEMPYEAMSELLNTSEGALKASYHHAVKKVTLFLQTH